MMGGGLTLLLLTIFASPAEASPLARSIAFAAFAVAQIGIALAAGATGYLMYAGASRFGPSKKAPAGTRAKRFRMVVRLTK